MRKLSVFNFMSLNGFFKGPDGDISWHRHNNPEEGEYAAEGAQSGSTLLFGRVTYQMMESFWPTPQAKATMPEIADGMNRSEKIVFSTTLDKAGWDNTRLIKGNLVEEVKKLKEQPGGHITILGSGSIISQLADSGLIDEYQLMIDPVAVAGGTPLFTGISQNINLKLSDSRIFKSGVVLLSYQPL